MLSIGIDLTDPYASKPRDVDVAIIDEAYRCHFLRIPAADVFAGRPTWVRNVTSGPRSGDLLVIDGPLALATMGCGTRESERLLGTPGHTPDALPLPGSRPFAGYIRGAVELANRLIATGWQPASKPSLTDASMLEAYPGSAWPALAGGKLPHKHTADGIARRIEILATNGVILPSTSMTHDELDATICALIGVLSRRERPMTSSVGLPSALVNGTMRQGSIVQPAVWTAAGTEPPSKPARTPSPRVPAVRGQWVRSGSPLTGPTSQRVLGLIGGRPPSFLSPKVFSGEAREVAKVR